VLRGLEIARDRGFTRIKIRSDYNSMRRNLRERFRSSAAGNNDLQQRILDLARQFEWIDFGYVPRRKNQIAHLLARKGRFMVPGSSRPEATVPENAGAQQRQRTRR
jgi:ribonuclease HI